MSNIILNVEILVGTSIYTAFREARDLANKLGVAYIHFNFNGLSITIGRYATEGNFNQMYDDVYASGSKSIVCNS